MISNHRKRKISLVYFRIFLKTTLSLVFFQFYFIYKVGHIIIETNRKNNCSFILNYAFQIIYVARNPKDVATSFFHHYRHIVGYEGLKSDFIKAFLNDQVIYAPFNEHVLDFWQIRNQPNILFIHYEDMKRNMTEVIIEASKFFGKKFTTEEIQKLCEHLSVESMRGNSSCNNDALVIEAKKLNDNGFTSGDFKFIRKGQVGSFKDEFSNEIDAQFETFMQQSCLIENGFEYKI